MVGKVCCCLGADFGREGIVTPNIEINSLFHITAEVLDDKKRGGSSGLLSRLLLVYCAFYIAELFVGILDAVGTDF